MECQRPDADTCIVVPGHLARLGPTVAVAAVEALAVSVVSCCCIFYPCLCTVEWRPVIEIRLGACRCRDEGVRYMFTWWCQPVMKAEPDLVPQAVVGSLSISVLTCGHIIGPWV